jgi:hypothetical protein
MLEWIKQFFASRYVKSFARYAITALATLLAGSSLPGLAELSGFIETHAGELSEILGVFLMGIVAWWSVMKNKKEAKK